MKLGANPLADGLPEPWAAEWGWDHFGDFVGFGIGGVVQRMRWVPPGTFLMGSPEGERGRYDYEGPQHEVEFSQGFWLGDTPVTQALWEVVMGSNPSRFKGPDRPVENVSWNDCRDFLGRLNALAPELEARLPSEAEWEHACRAGTEAATWVGDLEILGENNAPVLDPIAWYGGNSGQEFELRDGYDSSGWPNKQYPHKQAGTHPVARKPPNPLGLYDMLGNVYEWCLDAWDLEGYAPDDVTDPPAGRTGSVRVTRGGSWYSFARDVRAAFRYALDPSHRHDYLGFRLARGQEPGLGAEPQGPRTGRKTRVAGRGPGPAPPTAAAPPTGSGRRK